MICIQYKTKDLKIQVTGETQDIAMSKLLSELGWFRDRFPSKKYPKNVRKFTVIKF